MCCSSLPHTGRSQLGRITGSYSANGSYSAVIFKECFDLNSGFCHKLIELCWMELFGSFMALLIDLFASGSVHVNNMLATSSKDRAWLTNSMDHCFFIIFKNSRKNNAHHGQAFWRKMLRGYTEGVENLPLALLQVLKNRGSQMFMLTVKTLSHSVWARLSLTNFKREKIR